MTKKLVKEETTLVADHETGQVMSSQSKKVVQFVDSEPAYFKTYLEGLQRLKQSDVISKQTGILYECIRLADFDGYIPLTGYTKARIAEKCECSKNYVSNVIGKLAKHEILLMEGSTAYFLNPELFARGSWSNIKRLRNKYIQLTVNFSEQGTEFRSEVKPLSQKDKPRSK